MEPSKWTRLFSEPLASVWEGLLEFLPNLMAAIFLVVIGLILARVAQAVLRRILVFGQGRLMKSIELPRRITENRAYTSLPHLISRFTFWIILFIFVSAAVEALGLTAVSSIANRAAGYLPRVLAAVVILFVGVLLADFCRGAIARTARAAGIAAADQLSKIGQVTVLTLSAVVAVDEVGIESDILLVTIAILFGTVFGAAALSFGLGAKTTVGNIIASHYVQRTYRIGDDVRIGEVGGPIQEFTSTSVVLDTADGRVIVPALRFSEEISCLSSRDA